MNKEQAVNRRRRSWRERWSNVRQWLLEDQANVGLGGPPNHWHTSSHFIIENIPETTKGAPYRRSLCVAFLNDASEIWIEEKEEDAVQMVSERWVFSCRAEHFRKMALWYLWRWASGEWFGLRRWLYYKDLHRRCERFGERIAEVAKVELEKQWTEIVKAKSDTAK